MGLISAVYRVSAGYVRPFLNGDGFRFPGATSGQVDVKAPATPTSWLLTLPSAAPASNGYLLSAQTDGTSSWVAPAGGSSNWESTGGLFQAKAASVTAGDTFSLVAEETDGASAIAHILDNSATLANTSAKLLSVRNNTTLAFDVMYDGSIVGTGSTNILRGAASTFLTVGRASSNRAFVTGVDNTAGGQAHFKLINNSGTVVVYGAAESSLGSGSLLGITAGGRLALDITGQESGTDSYWTKSADSGGNTSLFYDGAEILRDDGTDVRFLASRGIGIYTAIGDAHPTVELKTDSILFGAGGATAVDITLLRAAANILALGTGDSFRLQGGTSGTVTISPAATITSWTLTLPTAAPASNGYVLTGQTDGTTSWAAGGGGGADTALSNLAAVAVNLALTPGTDNSIALNSTAKRFTNGYFVTSLQILAAASDANPTAQLVAGAVSMGAGGGSAVDVGLARDAAGILKVTNGSSGFGTFKTVITKWVTVSSSSNLIATDASLGNQFQITLGENNTLSNPTNAVDGQKITWRFKQDGTGSRTMAYGTNFRFGTDIAAATLTTTASKYDYLTAIYNATDTKWDVVGFVRGY